MTNTTRTPQKGISHVESFKVAGVTFNDRQNNLKAIEKQKEKGKKVDVGIEQYEYKGEPAISVSVNGLDIGNLQKKDVDYVLANQDRIIGFTDLVIDRFTNEDGKEIYYARVELLVKNKGTVPATPVETTVNAALLDADSPEQTVTPTKKPFYKNWKFWVAVGVGLTLIYILCVVFGLTK